MKFFLLRRLLPGWPFVVLAIALSIQFSVFFSSPEQFLTCDSLCEFHHIAYVANHLAAEGTFPLWNPYLSGGEPYYLTLAWLGHYNWTTIIIAVAAKLIPHSRYATHYLGCLWLNSFLILCGSYLFFRECGARPARAFLGTLPFLLINTHVVNNAINLYQTSLWQVWLFWCYLRWRATGAVSFWFAGVASFCFILNSINYAIDDVLFTIGLFLILARFLSPRTKKSPLPFTRSRITLALALILLALFPRIVVYRNIETGIVRIGRDDLVNTPSFLSPIISLQFQDWLIPFSGLNEEVPYPNLFFVFIPWAIVSRRHRWLAVALLVFAFFYFCGARILTGWLIRLVNPAANISHWFVPPFFAMLLFATATAVCGLENFLQRFPSSVPGRSAGGWSRHGGITVIAGVLAFLSYAARQDPLGPSPRLALLMMSLPFLTAIILHSGRGSISRTTASCWLTLLVAIPALFLVRGLPGQPSGPARHASLSTYHPPLARTYPVHWQLDDPHYEPCSLVALLNQQPCAIDSLWRMRQYNTLLRALTPEARRRILSGPLFFLTAKPREVASTSEAVARLNGDTGATAIPDLTPLRGRHYLAAADSCGTITIDRYRPEEVMLTVSLPVPGLLVYVDRDSPGWAAEIDGLPASIVRVNAMAKGVWLPAGRHRVIFTFNKPLFQLAVWLSLLTIPCALCLALFAHCAIDIPIRQ